MRRGCLGGAPPSTAGPGVPASGAGAALAATAPATAAAAATSAAAAAAAEETAGGREGCPVCLEPLTGRALHVYNCGHTFCAACSRRVRLAAPSQHSTPAKSPSQMSRPLLRVHAAIASDERSVSHVRRQRRLGAAWNIFHLGAPCALKPGPPPRRRRTRAALTARRGT